MWFLITDPTTCLQLMQLQFFLFFENLCYLPTHTLASLVFLEVQQIVHSSLVVILGHAVLYVLVLARFQQLLHLLWELVGWQVLVAIFQTWSVQLHGGEMLLPVKVAGNGRREADRIGGECGRKRKEERYM